MAKKIDDTPWSTATYRKPISKELKVKKSEIPKFKTTKDFTKFKRDKLK